MDIITPKPIIAIDFDDTLFDLADPLFQFINSIYKMFPEGTSLYDLPEDLLMIRLRDRFNITDDYIFNQHLIDFDKSLYCHNMPLIEGVNEALTYLSKDYHLVLATVRPKENRGVVQEKLDRNLDVTIQELYLLGEEARRKGKISFLKEIGACALIDDGVSNFKGIENTEIRGILFSRFYNDVDYKELGLEARADWYEIKELF